VNGVEVLRVGWDCSAQQEEEQQDAEDGLLILVKGRVLRAFLEQAAKHGECSGERVWPIPTHCEPCGGSRGEVGHEFEHGDK
jgi:hypothetical protein